MQRGLLVAAFAAGAAVVSGGAFVMDSEGTRNRFRQFYERLTMQNLVNICGTAWMTSLTAGFLRNCTRELLAAPAVAAAATVAASTAVSN